MDNMNTNQFIPDYASPPGNTLVDILELQGMSQVELAKRLGINKKTINEIIKGKAPITSETAIKLENVLGVPAHFWNTREQQYREVLARLEDNDRLADQVSWLDEIPIKELMKRKYIPNPQNKTELVQHALKFFGVASSDEWRDVWKIVPVAYRKSKSFESDLGSLAAWLRLGELRAQEISCKKYDERTLKENLKTIRSLTAESPQVFEPRLTRQCAESGIALVFVSELSKTHVSGAIRWMNPFKSIIQLSLRYKSDDQFWFTFFHEAGHVILHSSKEIFLEGINHEDEKETEADLFAANFLIPQSEYQRFRREKYFSKEIIRSFALRIGIAPGIVVGRLQHDEILPLSHCNDLKRRFTLVGE